MRNIDALLIILIITISWEFWKFYFIKYFIPERYYKPFGFKKENLEELE